MRSMSAVILTARRSDQNASRCAGALSDTLQVGMDAPPRRQCDLDHCPDSSLGLKLCGAEVRPQSTSVLRFSADHIFCDRGSSNRGVAVWPRIATQGKNSFRVIASRGSISPTKTHMIRKN